MGRRKFKDFGSDQIIVKHDIRILKHSHCLQREQLRIPRSGANQIDFAFHALPTPSSELRATNSALRAGKVSWIARSSRFEDRSRLSASAMSAASKASR